MDKDKTIFGIDISKNTFDVMDSNGKHSQFENNLEGFPKFLKLLNSSSHGVMKGTGYYHYQLAHYLAGNKILVSVENPLSIKRFIQMKLSRIKTDKSDAKIIFKLCPNPAIEQNLCWLSGILFKIYFFWNRKPCFFINFKFPNTFLNFPLFHSKLCL